MTSCFTAVNAARSHTRKMLNRYTSGLMVPYVTSYSKQRWSRMKMSTVPRVNRSLIRLSNMLWDLVNNSGPLTEAFKYRLFTERISTYITYSPSVRLAEP